MARKKMTIAALAGFVAAGPGSNPVSFTLYRNAVSALLPVLVKARLVNHGILVKKFNKVVVLTCLPHQGYQIEVFPILNANGRRRVAYMEMPS